MNEVWIRLFLVAGALVAALAVVALLRTRVRERPETIASVGLSPGVYLFTSAACLDCAPARQSLLDALGAGGFTEISWESGPETFDELGVTAVPATLIVRGDRDAKLYPGQPTAVLRLLGP